MAAALPGLGRRRGRRPRARDDRRDERAARAARRADRARDDRGLPRRDRDRPPGRAPRSTTSPRTARRRSSRASCASPCASGWGRTACSCRSTRARSAAVEAARAAGVEAVAVCLLFSFLHPEHERARRRGAARGAARRARLALERAAAGVPRVRALLDDRRRTPTSRPALLGATSRTIDAGSAPLVMQSSGGVVDVEPPRPSVRPHASSPGRRAASSARRSSRSAPAARDVLTFDMGGTSTDVAPVLGGEAQVDGRVGRRRRADPLPDGRHPHDRRGRRLDRLGWTTAARCASGRARRAPSPGPAVLRPRRRGADGDRREPRARLLATAPCSAARSTLDRTLAEEALARLGDELGLDALEDGARRRRASPTRKMARALRVVSRRARASTRAGSRSSPSAARARCTPARSPRSSASRRVLVPRACGRPQRARARGRRPAPRLRRRRARRLDATPRGASSRSRAARRPAARAASTSATAASPSS